MVLRITISLYFFALAHFASAESTLFFTDNYNTNLYKSNENVITFNNNLFSLIDFTQSPEIDSFFTHFFEENMITASYTKSEHSYQIQFNYKAENESYLNWSRDWHQQYEAKLNQLLLPYIKSYIESKNDTTAASIAFAKLLYYYSIKHSSSLSDFGRTRLNIQVQNVNLKQFAKNHISPNQTWSRMITNSKLSSFNESYHVSQKELDYLFLGPNVKSRIEDCVSLHLFDLLTKEEAKANYLSNYSYFMSEKKETLDFDSSKIKALLPQAFELVKKQIHSPSLAFYSLEDLNSLSRITKSYTVASFKDFLELFIYTNNYNKLVQKTSKESTYTFMNIKDTLQFKTNVALLKTTQDSLLLNQIAAFLLNNSFRELQIFGNAGKEEYLKIEKAVYKKLVKKYNTYSPLKMSKKVDLSLYRALVIFDYLYQKGVSPHKMFCLGKKHPPAASHQFTKTYFMLKY